MQVTDPRTSLPARQIETLLGNALQLADALRDTIARVVESGFEVERKADRSLVTSADREAELRFRELAATLTPEAGVLGEEFGHDRPEAEFKWVIDPVDGTAEFAAGLPVWGTITGLWFQGEPLLGVVDHPALGLRSHAAFGRGAFANGRRLDLQDWPLPTFDGSERVGTPSRAAFVKFRDEGARFDALNLAHRNIRVFHTCLTHSSAANGALDAALEWDAPLWDLGATRILIEEAGGRYTTLRSREQADLGTVYCAVFGRPRLVASLLEVLGDSAHPANG